MASQKQPKTVFLCMQSGEIVHAASSLVKLVNKTPVMQGKNYHYYSRKMRGGNECNVLNGDKVLKIQKLNYD